MTVGPCRRCVRTAVHACRGVAPPGVGVDDPPVQKLFRVGAAAGPWGPVLVACSPGAVLGIALLSPPEPFVAGVTRRTGAERAPGTSPLLDRAIAAVEAFLLDGRPAELESLPIALAGLRDWDKAVLGAVRAIPWGAVTSYGQVAAAIERHGAARAVGGAVGRNPLGLAVPCHRVIAADGTLGGYGGDWLGSREDLLAIKRELLAREGVIVPVAAERATRKRPPPDRGRSVHSAGADGTMTAP